MSDKHEHIIFLHIPKTGGSTLHGIIHRQYRKGQWLSVKNNRQAEAFGELSPDERDKIKVLKGHQAFGHHTKFRNPDKVAYITMLRDPIERIISNYYFILERPNHHTHKALVENNYTIADYVSSGVIANAENAQVRLLSDNIDTSHGECTREMLEQAKHNLKHRFAAVGINKCYDEFLMLIQAEFGWRSPYYTRQNKTKKRIKREELTEEHLKVIREYNALDIELFEYAKTLFEERWNAAPHQVKNKLERFKKRNAIFQKAVGIRNVIIGRG